MTIYPGSVQVEPMKYANKPSDSQVLSSWESGDWVAQQKIDGAWYQLEKTDDGIVYLFGRTLSKKTGEYTEKIDNVPHIKQWAEFYLPNGTTLIGEIYVPGGKSNDVTKIMGCTAANAHKRQFETDEYGGPIHYYVFDIIRYMGQDLCDIGFEKRYKQGLVRELELNLLAFEDEDGEIDPSYVHLAPLYEDNFEQHLQEIFANGGEGMVFKKKDCPYRAGKRTTASQMYKYKEHMDSIDLVCMELLDPVKEYTGKELETWPYWLCEDPDEDHFIEVDKTTSPEVQKFLIEQGILPITKPYYYGWKNAIRLGAYKDGQLVEVGRVASGLNDELRADLAANPSRYLGKVVEIECMSTTKDNAIRHPVFVRFRNDKDPSDCRWEEIFS